MRRFVVAVSAVVISIIVSALPALAGGGGGPKLPMTQANPWAFGAVIFGIGAAGILLAYGLLTFRTLTVIDRYALLVVFVMIISSLVFVLFSGMHFHTETKNARIVRALRVCGEAYSGQSLTTPGYERCLTEIETLTQVPNTTLGPAG